VTRLRVALAQRNLVVGDLDANVAALVGAVEEAAAHGCDLVVFPELAVTGYPPEDLLLKPAFVGDNLDALDRVAAATTPSCVAVVGFVDRHADGTLRNAAAVCHGGHVMGVYAKRHLPNYAVFDEQRYFVPGDEPLVLYEVAGVPVAVSICEDAWRRDGPIAAAAAGGARLVANLNASPYHAGKVALREAMLAERAQESGCPIVYVNLVGGQDELVFDGASLVVDAGGAVVARAAQCAEDLLVCDLDLDLDLGPDPGRDLDASRAAGRPNLPVVRLTTSSSAAELPTRAPTLATPLDPVGEIYEALVLGVRDYVGKNGFAEVVIGLSGGVDSSLVAAIAADALGASNVHGVLMPSRYSSEHSVTDADALADALGIDRRTIGIEPAHRALLDLLAPSLGDRPPGLTEENLQSRIRGVLLMALSNAFGWLVLTTSNKSESAVGFSTLYGDSAGGFAVIKDVPKLWVYDLCRWRNERARDRGEQPPIPEAVLTKPPSAELRPDQRDDQSLPPYDVLDPLLAAYVEQDRTVAELIAHGHDPDLVRRVARLVDLAEYKRRQFPPGPRVTTKAFGKDRRLPITNRYRG
jgi:NAD+ synthase (glutamine-hydrolysing)